MNVQSEHTLIYFQSPANWGDKRQVCECDEAQPETHLVESNCAATVGILTNMYQGIYYVSGIRATHKDGHQKLDRVKVKSYAHEQGEDPYSCSRSV